MSVILLEGYHCKFRMNHNIHLENGWIYHRTSDVPLDWCGKIKEFIVTTDLENDGTPKKDKDGNIGADGRAKIL